METEVARSRPIVTTACVLFVLLVVALCGEPFLGVLSWLVGLGVAAAFSTRVRGILVPPGSRWFTAACFLLGVAAYAANFTIGPTVLANLMLVLLGGVVTVVGLGVALFGAVVRRDALSWSTAFLNLLGIAASVWLVGGGKVGMGSPVF